MRRALLPLLLVVAVAGCVQTIAETPRQRLYAVFADYTVYAQIVRQAVKNPNTSADTKATLKKAESKVWTALEAAKEADVNGTLTAAALGVAETALRELRTQLVAKGLSQ